jgi:predicted secreted protein
MTAAVKGIGTTFGVGDAASPEVFTTIAEILTISGPNISAEEIEVTNLDSPNEFKEYISGLKDGGTIDIEVNWIKDAGQVSLRDDIVAGTKRNYELVFPTSPETTAVFNGLPLTMGFSADPASQVTASISIRISGAIVWS